MDPLAIVAAAVLSTGHAAVMKHGLLGLAIPAPPKFSVVYDGGAGYDPGSTDARTVGQYADTVNNVVHTTRGFSHRAVAQDIGQIFASSVLDSGQRTFFSHLLGTNPAAWDNLHGAQPVGGTVNPGTEAFSDYYAVAATGGLKPGESLLWGDTSIDRGRLHRFEGALGRLAQRQHLKPLNLDAALSGG